MTINLTCLQNITKKEKDGGRGDHYEHHAKYGLVPVTWWGNVLIWPIQSVLLQGTNSAEGHLRLVDETLWDW